MPELRVSRVDRARESPARRLPFPDVMEWAWTWQYVLLGIAVVLITGVLVALGVRYLEAQSRRESWASDWRSASPAR